MDYIKNKLLNLGLMAIIGCFASTTFCADRLLTTAAIAAAPVALHRAFSYTEMIRIPNASTFYRQHFDDALRAYGVSTPQKIALKNDSSMQEETNNNFYGVKINEKKLDKKSPALRIFMCWQSAMVHVMTHKTLDPATVEPILGGLVLACGYNFFCQSTENKIMLSLPFLWITHRLWDQLYSSSQKDNAFLLMAHSFTIECLIKEGKHSVVEEVLKEYLSSLNTYKKSLYEAIDSLPTKSKQRFFAKISQITDLENSTKKTIASVQEKINSSLIVSKL